ncbi:hypothetical protein CGCTS75_v006227 [Colletotrichum tropicale]|nr:hypothetical protein CGCTS75_v006227 [Colletotrichum tropicale]
MLFDTLLQGRFPRTTQLFKRWTCSERVRDKLIAAPGSGSSRSRRHSGVTDEAPECRQS